MANYRSFGNGFVNDALSDTELDNIFKNFALMRQDGILDFNLVINGDLSIETMREAKRLMGGSFRQFMEANYNGGSGPLATLVKDVVHFINGKMSPTPLITVINFEENKAKAVVKTRLAQYSPSKRTSGNLALLEDGYVVHDSDFFHLMAGIGPAHVIRFLQLIGGGSYYGQ
jgi:hypothetical protein